MALVDRHGTMILYVSQRVLGDVQAAEDVFQAVFLVLARKAPELKRPDALVAWLHGVARPLAWKARGDQVPPPVPADREFSRLLLPSASQSFGGVVSSPRP